jgi:cobalt-zinc-cadmium efflux system outer membrane protein
MTRLTCVVLVAVVTGSAHAQTPAPMAAAAAPITLEQLEARALEHNPTGTAAAAGVEAARGRTRQAGALPNPIVGYSGEEITMGAPGPRGEHGIFVEQTIPLGGKRRLSRDAAQKTIARAEAMRDLQRLRILSSVRETYYAVLLTERRIEVQERLAALASEAVGVTAQLFNVGAADRPDFLQIEIESRRLQLQLNRSRNERFALRAQLASLTGSPEVADRPIAGTIDAALPDLERDRIIRTVLEENPELRAARADLERTQAVTVRARRETFPDLFVRAGSAYNRERGDDAGRPLGWQSTLEAGISLPLFNRNAGGIAAAGAEETRARAEVARLELALRSRAAARFAAYLTALRDAEAYRAEILPRAEEAYRLYLSRYREMAAAYPQVLVAQRTFFELSTEYLQSLSDAWRAAVQLQGFLAGHGLDAPAGVGEPGDAPSMEGGSER